jgi:DNA gyrase subunit B
VDGSHIQTLLLTFFFRFLKPIVEKGYLYIAQPPLYRYKKGKIEVYLKDDSKLSEFLIENGIDSLDITGIGRNDLIDFFKLVAYYRMILKEIEKRYSLVEVVRFLIENKYLLTLDNEKLYKKIKEYLDSLDYNILSSNIDEEKIHLYVQTDEGLEEIIIDDELFTNPFYVEAVYIYEKIEDRIPESLKNKDLIKVLEEVEKSAKKGAYIQRYKGLGEMNPEQLWETTMDPQNRRLLRVTVENIESASEVFSLFMGDEVEPRKKYIEEHAKDVKHLDI